MKLIAKGNTAEIYEYGGNLICKLFYPQYSTKTIKHEFCNATMAWKSGIRIPMAHRLIMEDEETIAKINALWYCRICLE